MDMTLGQKCTENKAYTNPKCLTENIIGKSCTHSIVVLMTMIDCHRYCHCM